MKNKQPKKAQVAAKRPWKTPRVESSEVFNKAALACCVNEFNQVEGSAGSGLPFCT